MIYYLPKTIRVDDVPGHPSLKATRDYVAYLSPRLPGGRLTIPRGFRFNGASIPEKLRPVIGEPWEWRFVAAALLHDYLYREQPKSVSRADADMMFRQLLARDGVPRRKRWWMWAACRAFGGPVWRRLG